MKKIILLLITLITLTNVSYASFPITENNTCEVLSATIIQDNDDDTSSKYCKCLTNILKKLTEYRTIILIDLNIYVWIEMKEQFHLIKNIYC